MAKKTLKNILKVEIPFYKIKPGETATIELEKVDDIHYRGIALGHLMEVGKEKIIFELPKEKPKEIIIATSKTRKKKVR